MDTTQDTEPPSQPDRAQPESSVPALVLVHCPEEPWRVGEVTLFADADLETYLGRGEAVDDEVRARWLQQRPTGNVGQPPLTDPSLSRLQIKIVCMPPSVLGPMLRVELLAGERIREMRVNGEACKKGTATVGDGDTVQIRGSACKLLFYCAARPRELPSSGSGTGETPPFGWMDEHGVAGESPRIWRLRGRLAFAAAAGDHVLLHGPSGSGKELAARALHRLSKRSEGPFVTRSATSFNEGLSDADLFGCVADHSYPGDPARRGLFGEAEGGTLFIDDIGKLSPALQARLLRVTQKPGEYTPLGASAAQRSDVWVIGGMSGSPGELERDFAARFLEHIELPGLNDRREDIALLVQELALRFFADKPELGERFILESQHFLPPGWVPHDFVRLDPGLIDMLLRWTYTTHARELDVLVRRAIAESRGGVIEAYPGMKEALDRQIQARLRLKQPGSEARIERTAVRVPPADEGPGVDEERILRGLCDGTWGAKARAARALGISRQKLDRLLEKYGIKGGGGAGAGTGE
jgi:two-component system nitrogen regulation response regulator GlnG/two-component system response regulator HydG